MRKKAAFRHIRSSWGAGRFGRWQIQSWTVWLDHFHTLAPGTQGDWLLDKHRGHFRQWARIDHENRYWTNGPGRLVWRIDLYLVWRIALPCVGHPDKRTGSNLGEGICGGITVVMDTVAATGRDVPKRA